MAVTNRVKWGRLHNNIYLFQYSQGTGVWRHSCKGGFEARGKGRQPQKVKANFFMAIGGPSSNLLSMVKHIGDADCRPASAVIDWMSYIMFLAKCREI